MNTKNLLNAAIRSLFALKRPSKEANTRLLQKNGEAIEAFIIREARVGDIPELAEVHAVAWAQTYWNIKNPPTAALRARQWTEQFKQQDGSWFCLVVENPKGQLVGFASGRTYEHADLPTYDGELNKIYLLSQYQRLGLGRKMFCLVARRFISTGINNMLLFGSPQNPSCRFHEAMGGKRLYARNGNFDGGYGWADLHKLATVC